MNEELQFLIYIFQFIGLVALIRSLHLFTYFFWPRTNGEIVSAELIHLFSVRTPGELHKGNKFGMRILFKYNIGNNSYESDKNFFTIKRASSKSFFEKFLKKYPSGSTTQIIYHPGKHYIAYLHTPPPLTLVFSFSLSILMLSTPLFMR